MKKIVFCIAFVLVNLTSWAQKGSIVVQIKQNGNIVPVTNGVAYLTNDDFSFEITSHNVKGFLVGATFDKDLYKSALGEADLEVEWFENSGVADDMFNPNKEIIVSDEVPSYWYYTNAKDHRFDKTAKGTIQKWTATRTIHTLNNLSNYEMISVKQFKQSLYVCFYSPIYDEEYKVTDVAFFYNVELKFQ